MGKVRSSVAFGAVAIAAGDMDRVAAVAEEGVVGGEAFCDICACGFAHVQPTAKCVKAMSNYRNRAVGNFCAVLLEGLECIIYPVTPELSSKIPQPKETCVEK